MEWKRVEGNHMTGLVTPCNLDKCSHMCQVCSKQYLRDLPETHLSLIASPFHHSVFDCLQYAKMKGEGLGGLVT